MVGPGLVKELPPFYERKAELVSGCLAGWQGLSQDEWKPTARLFVLACQYGAGDALAGLFMQQCPHQIGSEIIASLRLLFIGWNPGGLSLSVVLWSLFEHKTGNEKVDEILEKLHVGAGSGRGFAG